MSVTTEVSSLLARIFHMMDDGDQKGFADCWAEDATLRVTLYGQAEPIVLSGRDQIVGMAADALRHPGRTRHVLGSVAVQTLTDDEATVQSYAVYINVGEEAGFAGMGKYVDRVRRNAAVWQIVERNHTFLTPVEHGRD